MAREKVDNKLNVVIGTKAQIEGDTSIPENSIIVVTDEELKADEIVYSAEKNVKEAIEDLETSKQDKLVAGNNITIDEANVISASGGSGSSGGELDPNEMAYFNYAGSIYGDRYSLLANAWQDMKDSETILFDIPLTLAPNQEIEGLDLYVGTNEQLQALYDACVNGTMRLSEGQAAPYYVNNVATLCMGNIGEYAFGNFGEDDTSFLIIDFTPSEMGLGLVLGKLPNVPIPNNNIVIQQGFEFDKENGIIIPNSVTSIGERAFSYWEENNQPLVIPNSVTSIGRYAFDKWASNNYPLVIPDSVTEIGDYAFMGWVSNNHPLVIPDSVTSVGYGAFAHWDLVPYVEIKAVIPPSLSYEAFDGQDNAPIYVPDESVDDYKEATNWVSLADRIFPISDKVDVIGDIKNALDAILGV